MVHKINSMTLRHLLVHVPMLGSKAFVSKIFPNIIICPSLTSSFNINIFVADSYQMVINTKNKLKLDKALRTSRYSWPLQIISPMLIQS